jgi:hypothetical protein
VLHFAQGMYVSIATSFPACSQCLHESLTAFPGDPQSRIGHLLFIDTVALCGRDRDAPSSMFNSPKDPGEDLQ